jgi:hypothetical protein
LFTHPVRFNVFNFPTTAKKFRALTGFTELLTINADIDLLCNTVINNIKYKCLDNNMQQNCLTQAVNGDRMDIKL